MKNTLKIILLFTATLSLLECNGSTKENLNSKTKDKQNSSAREKETDWKKDELKGKVKSCFQGDFELVKKFGNIEQGPFIEGFEKRYDEYGNIIENNWENEYGRNSKIKVIYKYDDNENIIEANRYDRSSLDGKYIFKYDGYGNKIENNWYDKNGNLEGKYIYNYDEYGNKIEEIAYFGSGSLAYKYIYKYDDNGNIIESNKYVERKGDEILDSTIIYEYDDNGNIIEESKYSGYGSLYYKNIYKYDEHGNIIESNKDGIHTYRYEYDDKGNWTSRIDIKNGKPILFTVRTYEYY
ncbi:hypothetical protein PG291_01410 [Riemerella anatipestifer]|nr:hypothetical protein [Riemerella anatipestifer]